MLDKIGGELKDDDLVYFIAIKIIKILPHPDIDQIIDIGIREKLEWKGYDFDLMSGLPQGFRQTFGHQVCAASNKRNLDGRDDDPHALYPIRAKSVSE